MDRWGRGWVETKDNAVMNLGMFNIKHGLPEEGDSANLCDGLCELTVYNGRHWDLAESIYFATRGIRLGD